MSITPADFKVRFPEFISVADSRIQLFIVDAELELNVLKWCDRYDKGISYLTAHYLSIALKTATGLTGSVNPVASRSVGDVSISFANKSSESQTEAYYNSTVYGQEYWNMLQFVGLGAAVVSNVVLNV
jgi:hypothetical protein